MGEIKPGKIQNLFTEILSIEQVASNIKEAKPELDIIYVNQDQQFGDFVLQQSGTKELFLDDSVKSLGVANFFTEYFLN